MNQLNVNGHFLHQRLTGVQRYAREILAGFDEGGYAYRILSPSVPFSSHKVGHHFWEQVLLPLKQKESAVLWSPTNTGPVYADNHGITLHDGGVFVHPEWFSSSYVQWRKMLIPRIVSRAKTIITVSEYSRKVICQHLNLAPEKVKVVYNGIDPKRFKPADSVRIKQVRAKYGLTARYLLALGSLDPRKNFARLVTAWNKYTEKNPNGYSLAIAGGSNDNFRSFQINRSDSIKLLGYVEEEDLPALYSGASGFLFPSLFEGFGLPVLEAMACGTPVLTSNTTALDEIAGDAAIKVSPGSVDSIYEGLLQLLESQTQRDILVNKGFQRIKLFDWNNAASAIYRHLMQ
ncbi:glycosyltransferase involved in cell wall biosynthesis [Anseongella ginsenosidimutans]|uniref:Glycosyltransferase involved in cell wall biosynthesis n=1 Tax=Anseongella ginsenosidimutans TaxID=496056 RepID=A0A4R3KTB8_9SPHI|nr:glycosyltransferase family 1 protein [Anseongella ginsenosidimutans]QEC53364.1 glycosyltransferase family 4 protein [Anseongella ginsenosidimutans]TCS88247.1 glycosyltransferase involved in cell wall biosynthesis [Anseongella ginsenosidimutans]